MVTLLLFLIACCVRRGSSGIKLTHRDTYNPSIRKFRALLKRTYHSFSYRRFSYLLHACKHVRLPNFDFDVPPVEEEAPPYHPITWLQLARNICDWTKDYLREAFAEDPAGEGKRNVVVIVLSVQTLESNSSHT